jgi:hypothetical protein
MAAHAIGIRHALSVEDVSDLVRLVAIHADGQDVCLLLPQLAADNLPMNLLDLRVTFGASPRDVLPRYRRTWIAGRQDQVGGMTRSAVRCDNQTPPEQAFTVDAFRVVLQDILLRDIPIQLDRRTLSVTTAADKRHLQRRHGRLQIGYGEDVVISVTTYAARCEGIVVRHGFAVHRSRVLPLFVAVAYAAIDSA